jgi:hypothetical protein
MSSLLEELVEEDFRKYGWKAINLARLKQAGFLIPKGFVTTGPLTQEDKRKISKLIPPFVVRSSSVSEDSKTISNAGKYLSELSVIPENLHDSVDRVFASYEGEPGGVIVQEQISAQYSGVIFTMNPVTGVDEVVIEITKGLSDTILSSGRSGNQYIVNINRNTIQLRYQTEQININNEELFQIATIGKRIEEIFKSPQDIEWVYDGNNILVVQSRPITTEIPLEWVTIFRSEEDREFVWKWNCRHTGSEPVSPLSASIIRLIDDENNWAKQRVFYGQHYVAIDERKKRGNITAKTWYDEIVPLWERNLSMQRRKALDRLSFQELKVELDERLSNYIKVNNFCFNAWASFPQDKLEALEQALKETSSKTIEELKSILALGLPTRTRMREVLLRRLNAGEEWNYNYEKLRFQFGDFLLHNFDIAVSTWGEDDNQIRESIRFYQGPQEKKVF